MLTLTHPRKTPAHRWPAAVKLVVLALASIAIFRLSPLGLGLAALGLIALYAALGRDLLWAGLRALWPLWPFVLILGIWHGFFGDWQGGLGLIGRMLLAVGAANLVTLTTPIAEMIALFEGMLGPLRLLGLNPRAVALSMALVIRFAPVLLQKQQALALAWRARSPKRAGWRLALPLTLAALDEADHVAEALRARGGVMPARQTEGK
ncbi:energy-coupling factor transporter transmembrane protein EcfT [Paracoccus sp. (in: a-proteobacteria)]|uniref:energy-coupling factor transporter transmembrane component T family protein n=1 Tax=Paracoccus sp. TaxID=267 RepID=UPI00289E22E0|nr:energy-coupling factor transporter transmembrane protein EcfT [Paracoccus sp. (in: a-proteobacteria)]